MSKYPLAPTFHFPVDRAPEQYAEYVALVEVARKIKEHGVRVDRRKMRHHVSEGKKRARIFTKMFMAETGLRRSSLGPSGAGKTDVVKEWFKAQGAPDVVFDKKSKLAQFNAAALFCWASDYKDSSFAKAAAALLGLRTAKTNTAMAEAYCEVSAHYGGRIHFSYNVLGTKGTRWSSSGEFIWRLLCGDICNDGKGYRLNAQNIPSRGTSYNFGTAAEPNIMQLKVSLRDGFIPDKGKVWMKNDFDGAEAKLIAFNSGDETLNRLIEATLDIHTATVRAMFAEVHLPAGVGKIDKSMAMLPEWLPPATQILRALEMPETTESLKKIWLMCRDAAKTAMYGLSYQAPSAKGNDKYPELFKTIKGVFPFLDETYFKELVRRFFALYPGLRAWQMSVCAQVEEGALTLPQNGKTLYLSPLARGKNQAMNFYQQSGLGVLINRALPVICSACDWKETALLAVVHDEADSQVIESRVDEWEAFVSSEMAKPANFNGLVRGISAKGDVGPSWGEVKPYKRTKT